MSTSDHDHDLESKLDPVTDVTGASDVSSAIDVSYVIDRFVPSLLPLPTCLI